MVVCTFCGKTFANRGVMFVLKSGQTNYLCSSKCEKNNALKRKGRNTKWTTIAQSLKSSTKKSKEK